MCPHGHAVCTPYFPPTDQPHGSYSNDLQLTHGRHVVNPYNHSGRLVATDQLIADPGGMASIDPGPLQEGIYLLLIGERAVHLNAFR